MKFFKSKFFKISFSIILTIGFIVLISLTIKFDDFLVRLKEVDVFLLVLASISLLVSFILRGIRFELLLGMKDKISFFFLSTIHYLLNKTLPARMGEATLPILLHRHMKIEYKKGISTLLFFRVQDIFVMVLFLLVSLFFVDFKNINYIKVIFFSILSIILLALFWLFFSKICDFLIFIVSKIKFKFMAKINKEIINSLIMTKEYKDSRSNKFVLKNLFVSGLNWFFLYFYYHLLLLAFHFDLNLFQSIFGVSVANFSFVIPNSFGSIGPWDAGFALGLSFFEISKDIAVPIGVFANIFSTILSFSFVSVAFIFFKIKKRKKTKTISTNKIKNHEKNINKQPDSVI